MGGYFLARLAHRTLCSVEGVSLTVHGAKQFWPAYNFLVGAIDLSGFCTGFLCGPLPRRGPHIASHSVCLSVCPSVRPSRYRASRRAT